MVSEASAEAKAKLPLLPTVGLVVFSFAIQCLGISWGTPSEERMSLLFPQSDSREKLLPQLVAEAQLTASEKEKLDLLREQLLHPPPPKETPTLFTDEARRMLKIYRSYFHYTFHPDDFFILTALSTIRPPFQLDPHYYLYGGWFLYPLGGAIWASGQAGVLHLSREPEFYLRSPEELGKVYTVARIVVVLGTTLATLFLILLGARLWNYTAGFLAGLLFTLLPAVLCFSHELKPHTYALGFVSMALYFGLCYGESGAVKWALFSGSAAGMAAGSAMTYLFAGLFTWLAIFVRKDAKWVKHLILSSIAALTVFLVANPFWLIAPQRVLHDFTMLPWQGSTGGFSVLQKLGLALKGISLPVSSFVLLAAVFGIGVLYFYKRNLLAILLAPVGLSLLASFLGGALPYVGIENNARFMLFSLPAFALCAALGLAWLQQKWKRIGFFISLAVIAGTFIFSYPYIANYIRASGGSNTRFEAGRWINANVPQGSSILVIDGIGPFSVPPFAFEHYRLYGINRYPKEVCPHDHLPEYALFSKRIEQTNQQDLAILLAHYQEYKTFEPEVYSSMSFANEPFTLYRRK